MKKESGFTLFELLTVIAIVGIVTAIATPSFLRSRANAKLKGAVSNLRGDLEKAKLRAIREHAFVVVLFSVDGYIVFVDNGSGGGTADDWTRNGSESILANRRIPAGVAIDLANTTFTNNRTRFNYRGLPNIIATEVVVILDSVNEKTITINRVGHIQAT